jgi:hypothetical protein
MGSSYAAGLAEQVSEGNIGLREAVYCHMQGNCYPPIPHVALDSCIQAIGAIEQDEPDALIRVPSGRDVCAREIVEGVHLEAFIGVEEPDA